MKKVTFYLAIIGVMLLLPFTVLAAEVLHPAVSEDYTITESSDNTVEIRTYKVTIDGNTDSFSMKFTMGPAITEYNCGDYGSFVATSTKNSDGTLTCTFDKNGSDTISGVNQVGTLTVTVKKNSPDADCTISYEGGKVGNPKTGVSLPYAIIAVGLVAAAGVYVVTNKKTKLYKI